ncbi:hypothetical protein ACFQ1S_01685 [Kibdelosporangium lantanae]|uniref:Uncharacterized protein n=1 Tax=Kibdelosporangium lantanae TaxID=1497396 RepID=A0ABW3M4T8_9PSEU
MPGYISTGMSATVIVLTRPSPAPDRRPPDLGVPLATIIHRSDRRSWRVPAVVSWAGASKVVPLAAALSTPDPLPYHDLVLLLTTAVIVTTLIVQSFTSPH